MPPTPHPFVLQAPRAAYIFRPQIWAADKAMDGHCVALRKHSNHKQRLDAALAFLQVALYRLEGSSFTSVFNATAPGSPCSRYTLHRASDASVLISAVCSIDSANQVHNATSEWTVLEKFKIHRYDLRLASSCGGGL